MTLQWLTVKDTLQEGYEEISLLILVSTVGGKDVQLLKFLQHKNIFKNVNILAYICHLIPIIIFCF